MEEQEVNALRHDSSEYYVGVLKILVENDVPPFIIIDCAVNNLLYVCDAYMMSEDKIELLEKILTTLKEEHSNESLSMQ